MRILPFLILFLLPAAARAQARLEAIRQLEAQALAADGPERAQKMIVVAESYLDAGDFAKAEKWAEDAAEAARRSRLPELRAAALNRQGQALLRAGKRAGPKFRQSAEILRETQSPNRALALDNLENLLAIAQRGGKKKEAAEIEAQIAQLRGGGARLPNTPAPPKPGSAPAWPGAVAGPNEREQKLLRESQELQAQLAAKEAAISEMSEAQMKNELLVMQQRQMLDSLSYRGKVDSLSLANWNLALREADSNRKFNYAIMGVLLLLAGGAAYGFLRARQNARVLEAKNDTIREEQNRSERLLLNVLPALVAEELKKMGRTDARYFEDVSVLFADFVGFSKIAEQLTPQQLVSELDTCFQAFDDIMVKYKLEKIKTIGDAYMCAGGLPNGGGSQLRDMVMAARDMQSWLADWNMGREQQGMPRFDARIGIHRGPVVAGVVGSRKFAFDIWGDTVNIAARIEQAGEGGRINISGEAYEVVKNWFSCAYRGKIAAKNKGEIDMYFVEN